MLNQSFSQSFWHPKKLIWHTTAMFLQRLHEKLRRLLPELWRKENWLLHHDNAPLHTSFFHQGIFNPNNTTVVRHPPYFSVSPTEDQTERPPF
jgi:hypothetical protein